MEEATPRTRAALTRSEQQLVRHASANAPTTRSINRQAILTEEEYTEGLEKIIARDFFPVLAESMRLKEEEEEIMQGFSSTDPDVIERSIRRMEGWMANTPAWTSRRTTAGTPRGRGGPQGTSSDTPRTRRGDWETPIINEEPAFKRQKTTRYDSNLSLDDFQAKYTSEDNASFAEIVQHENEARRSKYAWAYAAEQKANDKTRRAIEARTKLVDLARRIAEGDGEVRMIEGAEAGRPGERLLIEGRGDLPGDRASIEFAKRRLVAAPSADRLMIEGSKEASTSSASVQDREKELQMALKEKSEEVDKQRKEGKDAGLIHSWNFTNRNSLYFAPDANVPIHEMARHPLGKGLVDVNAVDELGLTEPKGIRYQNTRMDLQEELEEQARLAGIPPSPSHSNIAAAISGTPYPGRPGGSMTPRVQGYGFVDAMPSPTPSQLGTDGMAALMTFGTLVSTPVALRDPNADDPASTPRSSQSAPAEPVHEGPFKIPKPPRREALAHQLASKATKSLQKRHGMTFSNTGLGLRKNPVASGRGGTPKDSLLDSATGSGTPRRDAFLSPAAKTLLGRTRSGKALDSSPLRPALQNDREREGREKLKRATWDPSPLRK